MERPLTYLEAWEDFNAWFRSTEKWKELSTAERNAIVNAQRDFEGARIDSKSGKVLHLGPRRIEGLLTKYAPDRYRFERVVYLNAGE